MNHFASSKQYQEQVIYETKIDSILFSTPLNETQIGPEVIHEYKLMNKGPSDFLASELIITWQTQIEIDSKNAQFLYLMELPYLEGPIKCQIDQQLINPLNITVMQTDALHNPGKYYGNGYTAKKSTNQRRRSFINDYEYINPDKYVNCASAIMENDENAAKDSNYYLAMKDTSYYESYCASMRCKIGHLNLDEKALVRLRFRIWSNNLAFVSVCRGN